MFKKILIPFDGFGLADGILPFIPQLAKDFGSSVIMLWVMEPNAARSSGASKIVELEEAARRLSLEVADVEPMVTVGSPAPTIIRIAAEESCDLIAMATHGRGILGRRLFGSVADEVIRYSSIPIMVFAPGRADQEWGENGKVDRIVVPLDGSSDAETVLPYVAEIARRMNLEIILIHVSNPDGIYGGAGAGFQYIPMNQSQMDQMRVGQAAETLDEEYLETVTERLRAEGLPVRGELLEGSPGHRAARFARKTEHNIVALATRGHSGFERWIEGSVSELAVRGSGDPVLIIPPTEEEPD